MDTEPLELSPEGHSDPLNLHKLKKKKNSKPIVFGLININSTKVYIYY